MRANSVIILVIAILMGGVAAFLARNWLLSRTPEIAANTTIVVASRQLPFGTLLTADNVQEIPWAAKVLPEGSFQSKQVLFKDGSRTSLATIQQGEPVLSSKVTGPGERASLSTLIEKDKRAITIRVDDVRGVAGFILPNDRVDVMLIRTVQSSPGGREISDLLLQDVKVIAVDQIASEQKDKDNRAIVAKAVTLEVTPFQAQKISLASSVGHLSLILRKAGDPNVVADRRVTEADLSAGEPVAPMPPPRVGPARAQIQPPPMPSSPDLIVSVERNFRSEDYKVGGAVR